MAANGIHGRWDIVRPYVDDNIVIHLAPSFPFGGDYHGWDGYLKQFSALHEFFKDLKAGPADMATHDDKVIVMITLSGRIRHNDKPVTLPMTTIWRVKDGKVVEITPYYFDTKSVCDLAAQ